MCILLHKTPSEIKQIKINDFYGLYNFDPEKPRVYKHQIEAIERLKKRMMKNE